MTLGGRLWPQGQIDGVHGGSKARTYHQVMRSGAPMDNLVSLYLGIGRRTPSATHPAAFPMLTSRYRLPSAVEAIALDRHGGEGGAQRGLDPPVGVAEGPISQERYSLFSRSGGLALHPRHLRFRDGRQHRPAPARRPVDGDQQPIAGTAW